MNINPINVIRKIQGKLNAIVNALSKEQLKHYQNTFVCINQDLKVIIDCEQGTIESLDWRKYCRTCWDVFNKLNTVYSHMNKDFLHQYAYNFIYIYRNVVLLIDNQQELELKQMHQYYDKLSETNKNKVDIINNYVEGIDNVKDYFFDLLSKLTIIDKKDELTANLDYITILCELAQIRSDLNCGKLDVYFDESFIPDEVPSDPIKEKDQ